MEVYKSAAEEPADCWSICWQVCMANGYPTQWMNDTIVWWNLPA